MPGRRFVLGALAFVCAAAMPNDGLHLLATHGGFDQAFDRASGIAELSDGHTRSIAAAIALDGAAAMGAARTQQPGVAQWDARGQVRLRQINLPPQGSLLDDAAHPDHDAPQLAVLASGAVVVPYGAANTYGALDPPAAWACGTGTFCEPFKFAAARERGDLPDALARSPEYLLPSTGLSEISAATLGDATILAGQQQVATPRGEAGAQGYVVLHARGDAAWFETADGPREVRSAHARANGMAMVTAMPTDDAYADVAVDGGEGTGDIGVTIGDRACILHGAPGRDAVRALLAYAAAVCTRFTERYALQRVSYDPLLRFEGRAPADALGITAASGDPARLPAVREVRITCTGAIACGSQAGANRAADVRESGLHRHFLWGGLTRAGPFIYDVLDVEQVTGSWDGAGHNALALALACFRTRGERDGAWIWTDCAGHHPFAVKPDSRAPPRLSPRSPYLIGAPLDGYAAGMLPFVFDWRMRAQPPADGARGYPVLSAHALVRERNGDLAIAYGCQDRGGAYAVCMLRYDGRSGRTRDARFAVRPQDGGSLASLALRSDPDGRLHLAILAGMGARWGCARAGPCAMSYAQDANGGWRREKTVQSGGANDAGFPGSVTASGTAFIVLQRVLTSDGIRVVSYDLH